MCRTPTPTASPTPQRVGDLPPLAALRFLPVIGLAQAGSGTSLTFGLNYTSKAAMDRPASVTLIISQATLNVQLIYRLRDDPSRNPVQGTVWSYPMSIDVREKDALVFGGVQIPTGSIGPTLIQAGISSQVPLLIAWLRTRFKHEPARPVRRKRNPPSR